MEAGGGGGGVMPGDAKGVTGQQGGYQLTETLHFRS